MRGVVWAVYLSAVLVWAPLTLWIWRDVVDALVWWAGVATMFAARAAGEVNYRRRKQ